MARWAGFFGVSTSGYYTWRKEHPDRQSRLDAYGDQIEEIFDESGGSYGADRIAGELRKRGIPASFCKVKRIMAARGLFSVHLRYRRGLTDSRGARDEDCGNLLGNVAITAPSRRCPATSLIFQQAKALPTPAPSGTSVQAWYWQSVRLIT